jgi:hypothetical protein
MMLTNVNALLYIYMELYDDRDDMVGSEGKE